MAPALSVRAIMAPGSERADMILKKFWLLMHFFRLFAVVVVVLFRFFLFLSSLKSLSNICTLLKVCLHGVGGPQVDEVTRLGRVTHLSK